MVKIDVKDRKLLYYLYRDARQSNTQLARLVGLSKNGVKYRIDRLRKEGVIRSFAATLNLGTVGLDTFPVLLKFNDDIYENREIIDFFAQHPFVDSVTALSGRWDLFVEFVYKDVLHISQLINPVLERFGSVLNSYKAYYAFDRPLRVEHLVTDFYSGLELEEIPQNIHPPKRHELDEVDRKILYEFNKDSSMPALKIAQRLEMSVDVVRYRLKIMKQKGVILIPFAEVDLGKLGYTEYLCQMKLKNASQERLEKIKNRIRTHGSITYAFLDITSYTIMFMCAFRKASELDHMMRIFRKDFSDIIDEQEYLIQKEQFMFNLFPKGLLEGGEK
ncbi:AsnC family transcriptional regulator [Candidatus Woesearchaeota archaeon]|nr:AsnC family transcriptional regulator [Candidatus Woesearchaeota archaeon]